MNYEEKYKQALERARYYHSKDYMLINSAIENIFPELKEDEDERIRKKLICFVENWKKFNPNSPFDDYAVYTSDSGECDKILAWLEKQGESTITNIEIPFGANDSELQEVSYYIPEGFYAEIKDDRVVIKKVEPTFKVGDWIVNTHNRLIWQITCIRNSLYYLRDVNGNEWYETYDGLRDNYHLWSINDAKDGDVLAYVTDEEDLWIMIYRSLYEPYEGHVHYHALLVNDNFSDKGTCCICIDNLKPATKEQRDLLIEKMEQAGYEWDAEKKELKKMEVASKEGEK